MSHSNHYHDSQHLWKQKIAAFIFNSWWQNQGKCIFYSVIGVAIVGIWGWGSVMLILSMRKEKHFLLIVYFITPIFIMFSMWILLIWDWLEFFLLLALPSDDFIALIGLIQMPVVFPWREGYSSILILMI